MSGAQKSSLNYLGQPRPLENISLPLNDNVPPIEVERIDENQDTFQLWGRYMLPLPPDIGAAIAMNDFDYADEAARHMINNPDPRDRLNPANKENEIDWEIIDRIMGGEYLFYNYSEEVALPTVETNDGTIIRTYCTLITNGELTLFTGDKIESPDHNHGKSYDERFDETVTKSLIR